MTRRQNATDENGNRVAFGGDGGFSSGMTLAWLTVFRFTTDAEYGGHGDTGRW
jgi:hypothetical protein